MLPPGCEPRCPGCAHRELSAEESETQKTAWLRRALSPWSAALEPVRAVQGEERWHYRDKTLLHASHGAKGWEFGMRVSHGRYEEDEFVPIPRCPVHTERVRTIVEALSRTLPAELALFFISISGALVTLVLKEKPRENVRDSLQKTWSALAGLGVAGLFVNFNPSAGHRVFSSRGWTLIAGAPIASGPLGIEHGPQSFQQLIPSLQENALDEARAWLRPGAGDFVLDLYSGLGLSLHRWKSAGAESLGVELLGEAAKLAGEDVLQGRASERIPQLASRLDSWKKTRGSGGDLTLFTNPPRTGMEAEVLEWIGSECRPARIAYLSCSAGTLARDLLKLEKSAYRVQRIIPYDFFPQTRHIETLACLELDSASGVPAAFSGERLRRPE